MPSARDCLAPAKRWTVWTLWTRWTTAPARSSSILSIAACGNNNYQRLTACPSGNRSPIGNSDIASMLARRLRGHVPLRAASPQHGCACVCLGFSFAGSCAAAGCKPATQPGNRRAWFRRTDREQLLVYSVHNVHPVHFINR